MVDTPRPPDRPPLRDDLLMGLAFSACFSIIAIMIVVGRGVCELLGVAKFGGWSDLPVGLALIVLAYVVAGATGGLMYWLLRPLRGSVLGCLLTGWIVGMLIYGSMDVSCVLGYYLGVNLLNLKSAAEGWRELPTTAPTLGALVGMPLGLAYWLRNRRAV